MDPRLNIGDNIEIHQRKPKKGFKKLGDFKVIDMGPKFIVASNGSYRECMNMIDLKQKLVLVVKDGQQVNFGALPNTKAIEHKQIKREMVAYNNMLKERRSTPKALELQENKKKRQEEKVNKKQIAALIQAEELPAAFVIGKDEGKVMSSITVEILKEKVAAGKTIEDIIAEGYDSKLVKMVASKAGLYTSPAKKHVEVAEAKKVSSLKVRSVESVETGIQYHIFKGSLVITGINDSGGSGLSVSIELVDKFIEELQEINKLIG